MPNGAAPTLWKPVAEMPCKTIGYHMSMARTQTLVQLNDALLAALDQRAARRSVSRSRIIREAIEAYLGHDHEAEITNRIVAGYERVPQATHDVWGDPTAHLAETTRLNAMRLNEEERASGEEPW